VALIGVDVGGTFTDLVYVSPEGGRLLVHKVPTSGDDPSVGTLAGIRELCDQAGDTPAGLERVLHGTTTATNIVLEHNGARVGMVTTAGYRDILHVGRQKRPFNFSNYQDLPWQSHPLVRRRFRKTVSERTLHDGTVLVPLDEDAVRDAVRALRDDGCESIAVCLLFSFVNPAHEQRVKEIVEEEFPDAFLSVSSEILSQYREYERFSTTALNAYVGPRVASYVARLDSSLRDAGVRTGVHLMTSSSGVVTAEGAVARPVNLVMSGPVAGVIGSIWAAGQAGFDNVITVDVGGTSADVGLAERGALRMKHLLDTRVGAYQAMIPMVDVDTVGAGGGSIAYVDDGGVFRVGPRSAGAQPGPACYDRGGTEATATDAMLVLGRLDPVNFLGGNMTLRDDLARAALENGPAGALGMGVEEAAAGAVEILVHGIVQAIEQNSVRKGYDPREFVLVAAGGAGPMFAAEVGREVGTPTVLVPLHPGITSALGLLATDLAYEYAATEHQRVGDLDADRLGAAFARLEGEARRQLEADEVPAERMAFERAVDCRYEGQGYELRVPAGAGELDSAWVAELAEAFHSAHEREFARRDERSDIEIVTVRVRGVGVMPALETAPIESGGPDTDPEALLGVREVWFRSGGRVEPLATSHYERDRLRAGNVLAGPAVIHQFDTTTVLPPDMTATVDGFGNLVIDCSGGGA
jgi:N-methylhydantoinase A/oxoprolinase/acetone carboxylase beta subunit